jgi:glutathione S-transferase
MTCKLIIGQKNYSSWSMRAWLLLKMIELPFDELTVSLYQLQSRDTVRALGGQSGLVPVLLDGNTAIWDTMAIFEYLHESHPKVWPPGRLERARARSVSGEVHSGFHSLRSAMPLNARARNRSASRSPAVLADIERVTAIWSTCSAASPWLFGDFGGADIMFAPIATRFRTYCVQLEGEAQDYMDRLLRSPLVAEWVHLAEKEKDVIASLEIGAAQS